MGQLQTKEQRHKHVKKIVDRVFDRFTAGSGEDKLNFQELYTAILLVYNDINKRLPGPHQDPPPRNQVQALLEEFDTNENRYLDRDEFSAFLDKFTRNLYHGLTKSLVLYSMAPLLAFAVKRATENIPRVGPVVRRIPNFVYSTVVTTAVALFGQAKQIED